MCPSAANGPAAWARKPVTARPRRPSGRAAWIRFFCTRWPDRWYFAVVVLAVFQTLFTAAVPLMNGVDWLFNDVRQLDRSTRCRPRLSAPC